MQPLQTKETRKKNMRCFGNAANLTINRKKPHTNEMKICKTYVKWDARNGRKKLVIIVLTI